MFGVPDAEMGEVKAVVQPAAGAEPGPALAEEIIAFCRDHLSHLGSAPRSVKFTDALPRGENGKLSPKQLRDSYWPDPARGSLVGK